MDILPYILALSEISALSPATVAKILEQYPNPKDFFQESAQVLQTLKFTEEQIKAIKNPPWEKVNQALIWSEKADQHIVTLADPGYPTLLKMIHYPPIALYVKGKLASLNLSQIAMVGSRNPSHYGVELAEMFAYNLASAGLGITSGLAIGIDGASHIGAMKAKGGTVAVLGTGLNVLYPKCHHALAEQIIEKGALFSEFPLNSPPLRQNFPRRNRIISGLAKGVLVVEAAQKSGSLITARYALEQGREVFAIPHSLRNPLGKGCHALLRQGAKMVERVEDILEEIMPQLEIRSIHPHINTLDLGLAEDECKLVQCIGHEVASVEQLISRSGMAVDRLNAALLSLELKDVVVKDTVGYLLKNTSMVNACP